METEVGPWLSYLPSKLTEIKPFYTGFDVIIIVIMVVQIVIYKLIQCWLERGR